MNWEQFKKNVSMLVQLEPPACRLDENGHALLESYDDWRIERIVDNDVVVLRNIHTDHFAELGKDHIYDFRSNPSRSKNGTKHGFLILKVQVFIQGANLWLRPNAKPGEPLPTPPVHIAEKWVDIRYPSDSGILANLESLGYRVAWCFDSRLARKVELEDWEVVVEKDNRGMPTSFHLRDKPENQVLIKTRSSDLDAIAAKANVSLRGQKGFISCKVESINPPVLAFRFREPVDAIGFQIRMSASTGSFEYSLAPGRLDTILEHRT